VNANSRVELHGLEDGTIPATFQVIFLVRFPSPLAERMRQETNASGVDRVETESESAKAFAEGKWADEFKGCVVVEDVRCHLERCTCRMAGRGCPTWRMMICNNTQSTSMTKETRRIGAGPARDAGEVAGANVVHVKQISYAQSVLVPCKRNCIVLEWRLLRYRL
jgi:hypothetical protein